MLKVGITGGIGSGKSIVARVFAHLGVPVYNADEQAKWLMNNDQSLKQQLIQAFGTEVYQDGQLNRSWLAGQVFGNPDKLAVLNSLVHPAVIAHGEEWMAAQKAPYALKEAALFFESGSAAGLDMIIGVYAPKPLRLLRSMRRDGASREEILQRMSKQIDEELKMRLCDGVIVNDDLQMVVPQVLHWHQQFLKKSV